MVDKDIKDAVDEAARLIRDNPELKFYEAIEKAKEKFGIEEVKDESKASD